MNNSTISLWILCPENQYMMHTKNVRQDPYRPHLPKHLLQRKCTDLFHEGLPYLKHLKKINTAYLEMHKPQNDHAVGIKILTPLKMGLLISSY